MRESRSTMDMTMPVVQKPFRADMLAKALLTVLANAQSG